MRGAARDDIRPGVRLTHHRKRTTIAFTVNDSTVTILGVFYGGQDVPGALHEDNEPNA
jgi:plasmid stabilization system protein ParE